MARKSTTSKALVPVSGVRAKPRSKGTSTVAVATAIPEGGLGAALGSEEAAAKLPGEGGTVVRAHGTTLVTGRAYATRDGIVPADEVYFTDDSKAREGGVWLGEADKVAWRDEASGYECIVMRETYRGYLSGFVGVPVSHPLWGWSHRAVPGELGIEVHGGLTYSRVCEDGPSPIPRIWVDVHRICHVPRTVWREPTRQATGYEVEEAHAWWFGFDCNHAYDLVPADDMRPGGGHNAEIGSEYRDDACVIGEVRNLAAQLRAVADGHPAPPRRGPPLPPIGLDPSKGGSL